MLISIRYDPVDNVSTTCEGNNCIGGFSRLFSAIMELKKHKPNSIVLNAGDNFQGTLWYIVHKWNVTQHFLNKLPLDAIVITKLFIFENFSVLYTF